VIILFRKLLEKELVEIQGKSEGVGRPLIYGTSEKFMEYFGLILSAICFNQKDFSNPDNQIGEQKRLNYSDNSTLAS